MKKKKRPVTLIEIMIVILLIGLIGGALAFNMRGSMDKGKIFKSEQNAARVHDILMMEYAKSDETLAQIVAKKKTLMKNSLLVKDGEKLLNDAWGNVLEIEIDGEDLKVYSKKARELESGKKGG